MFGQTFYNQSIRRYITAFGTLFSNISIQRMDKEEQNVIQIVKVPIEYGNKESWYDRLTQDPDLGSPDQKPVAIVLPRMSWFLKGVTYDPTRKLPSITQNVAVKTGDNTVLQAAYAPVPHNFQFELAIYARNMNDLCQIVEQILPYFSPDFTISMVDLPALNNQIRDIPVIIQGNTPPEEFEGEIKDRQVHIWRLDFLMRGYLYPPTNERKVILNAMINTKFLDGPGEYTVNVSPNPSTALATDPFTFTDTEQSFD